MPIHEADPWRRQYFEAIECPPDVHIPTDDPDAYARNPRHRWVYNKLLVAESQALACAPHGVEPVDYPVFSKPIINLRGMGMGSRVLRDRDAYLQHHAPGHFWMTMLRGEHLSSDVAVADGEMLWCRHTMAAPLDAGTFDYWRVDAHSRPALEARCREWIRTHLHGYTGMLNLESIDNRLIEIHLRFTDQWPDLYGKGWLLAVVRLYQHGVWDWRQPEDQVGYSVVLFGPHGREYRHPPPELVARHVAAAGISSIQITFHDHQPAAMHAMPPGGFRLAIINCWDLDAGREARRGLARHFIGREAP